MDLTRALVVVGAATLAACGSTRDDGESTSSSRQAVAVVDDGGSAISPTDGDAGDGGSDGDAGPVPDDGGTAPDAGDDAPEDGGAGDAGSDADDGAPGDAGADADQTDATSAGDAGADDGASGDGGGGGDDGGGGAEAGGGDGDGGVTDGGGDESGADDGGASSDGAAEDGTAGDDSGGGLDAGGDPDGGGDGDPCAAPGSDQDPACYCKDVPPCGDARCTTRVAAFELLHSQFPVYFNTGTIRLTVGEHQGLAVRRREWLVDERAPAQAGTAWDGAGIIAGQTGQLCEDLGVIELRPIFDHGGTIAYQQPWYNLPSMPNFQAAMPAGATYRWAGLYVRKYDNFSLTKPDDPAGFAIDSECEDDAAYGCVEKFRRWNMITCTGPDVVPDGYCDHACGNDGYTAPAGRLDPARTTFCGDVSSNTIFTCKTAEANVPASRQAARWVSLAGFTTYAPRTGHNSNNDAQAAIAAFASCPAAGGDDETLLLGPMDINAQAAPGICASYCDAAPPSGLACATLGNIAQPTMTLGPSPCVGCMNVDPSLPRIAASPLGPTADCWQRGAAATCGGCAFTPGKIVQGL